MEEKIIRRLSKLEIIYDNEAFFNNMILARVFLIDVSHGEMTFDLLRKACTFWIKRHPLLRAKILRTNIETERFFVELDDSEAFKLDNIEVLNESQSQKWIDIMTRDQKMGFDMNKGPLWRLKIVKLSNSDNLNYNYAMFLTTQHSIGDGRNCYEIGVQLLNILAALLENKTCEEMNENVIEDSLFTSEELFEKSGVKLEPAKSEHDQNNRDSVKLTCDNIQDPSHRFKYYCLKAEKFTKFQSQVKSNTNGAKTTSVFLVLVSVAFKKVFKKLRIVDIPTERFQFNCLVSLREKFGEL
jgi:hypothetical protein